MLAVMTEVVIPRASPVDRPEFAAGIRLFNATDYHRAHEAWEAIWLQEDDPAYRLFLQGLIQVAAAFHKLFVQHKSGPAARLLVRGLDKLDRYPANYLGVALGPFCDGARVCVDGMSAMDANDGLGLQGLPRSFGASVPFLRLEK
jgi:Domain of unknown function (DUF309)